MIYDCLYLMCPHLEKWCMGARVTHITLACKNTCVTALCDALSSSPVPLMMRVSLWPLLSSVPAVPLVVVVFPLFVAPVVMVVVMMVWRFLFLCLFRERVWIRLLFGKRPRGATVMMMMVMMVMAVVFVTASPFTRLLVVVSFSVSLLSVVIVQTSLLLSLVLMMMMMMMMVVFIKARLLTRSALIWKHMSGIMQLYGFANTN